MKILSSLQRPCRHVSTILTNNGNKYITDTCVRNFMTITQSLRHQRHTIHASSAAPLSLTTTSSRSIQYQLPVIETYVPRKYPFPIILTTEFFTEEHPLTEFHLPHNMPHYKSTLTVDIQDLPLTVLEKRIFARLVGPRMFSAQFDRDFLPEWLLPTHQNIKLREELRHQKIKLRKKPNRVKFTCRLFPSQEANENRVFQLLEECIRQSKILARELSPSAKDRLSLSAEQEALIDRPDEDVPEEDEILMNAWKAYQDYKKEQKLAKQQSQEIPGEAPWD